MTASRLPTGIFRLKYRPYLSNSLMSYTYTIRRLPKLCISHPIVKAIVLLPWTAYLIEHEWRNKKFIKEYEYEEYIKNKERQ